MSWNSVFESVCPIARTSSVLGDRWTMLIMRELSMGVHRFDDIQAQIKMSSHLLASRLKRLEQDGVIERRKYSDRPPRYEYHATQKGKELDPILLAFRSWGMKWGGYLEGEEPAVNLKYRKTGKVIDASWRPPADGKPFSFKDTESQIGEAFHAERERNREEFSLKKAKRARKNES